MTRAATIAGSPPWTHRHLCEQPREDAGDKKCRNGECSIRGSAPGPHRRPILIGWEQDGPAGHDDGGKDAQEGRAGAARPQPRWRGCATVEGQRKAGYASEYRYGWSGVCQRSARRSSPPRHLKGNRTTRGPTAGQPRCTLRGHERSPARAAAGRVVCHHLQAERLIGPFPTQRRGKGRDGREPPSRA